MLPNNNATGCSLSAHKVFAEMPNSTSKFTAPGKRSDSMPPVHSSPHPWTYVVQTPHIDPSKLHLEYFPPLLGSKNGVPVIKPPREFLVESQKAWNTSIVGYFLGSNLPFKLVEEEAK